MNRAIGNQVFIAAAPRFVRWIGSANAVVHADADRVQANVVQFTAFDCAGNTIHHGNAVTGGSGKFDTTDLYSFGFLQRQQRLVKGSERYRFVSDRSSLGIVVKDVVPFIAINVVFAFGI